jgi:outer membrane protein OmpA-like peptidoglycan-associated protein
MQFLKYILILFFGFVQAQKSTHSVYFEFDKFALDEKQGNEVVDFIKQTDSTKIESIQIFGYTDDVGKEEYNINLSNKRANAIQEKLKKSGITSKVILTIEGKGSIYIKDPNAVHNVDQLRSQNRRVDVVLNLKPIPKAPSNFKEIRMDHVVGDQIYLEKILFAQGSSKLTPETRKELDRLAILILKNKTLEFEIQGHVCCTPPNQHEAVDMDTHKRTLSKNRAEVVYNYFISKKIKKERMTFKGYGSTVPLGREPDYDRRVELKITKI